MSLPASGFVDVRTVAGHMSMAPSWVRAHAADLGGHKFGSSLRFDVRHVQAAIDERRITVARPGPRRRPGPKPGGVIVPADVRQW